MDAREFLEEVEPEDCHDNIKGTVEPEQLVNSINIDNKALNIIHVNIGAFLQILTIFLYLYKLLVCGIVM